MKIKTILTVVIEYDSEELDILDEPINWAVDKLAQRISSLINEGENSLTIAKFDYNNNTEEIK